jgi:hypothetical protein
MIDRLGTGVLITRSAPDKTMTTKPNLDLILVKASATALLTLALFRLPDLFRAIAQLIASLGYFLLADPAGETGAIASKLNQNIIASATGDLVAFAVLLLLARWMFGFPKFMRSAFMRADDSNRILEAESGPGE